MKLTDQQCAQLGAAAQHFSEMLSAWTTSLSSEDKSYIVAAALNGARLAIEYTPQPAPGFRMTMIARDEMTRVVLAEVPAKICAELLQ